MQERFLKILHGVENNAFSSPLERESGEKSQNE